MMSFRARRALPALSVVAVAVSLAACDGSSGSSSSSAPVRAQAIDGYLVGSAVYCDGTENGSTSAGGSLTCPTGTDLIKILNGSDVGFDETATDGGEAFPGQLLAPGGIGYVTPLTNVAVELSGGEDGFDAGAFAGSVETLAKVLGIDGLDLSADPADATSEQSVRMAKANAQISQIVASFGQGASDYAATAAAMAAMIKTRAETSGDFRLDLDAGTTSVMTLVNETLKTTKPDLSRSDAELATIAATVATLNAAIASAEDLDTIDVVAKEAPPITSAMTIDRDAVLISYDAEGTAGAAREDISLESFESTAQGEGRRYGTVIEGSGRVSVNTGAFSIDNNIDETITVGFSLDSTDEGDERAISVVTQDAKISATKGDSDSLSVMLAAGSKLLITSTTIEGTTTDEVIELKTAHEFVAGSDGLNISFWNVDERLDELGFGDLTATVGNYRMTVAIGELEISEKDGNDVDQAPSRTVTAFNMSASGSGFLGYVTIVPDFSQN